MRKIIFILLCCLFSFNTELFSFQIERNESLKDSLFNISRTSSTISNFPIYKPGSNAGIDTVVKYKATDTVKLNLRNKTMYLRGEAKVDYSEQHLNSEILIIDFVKSNLFSQGVKDSLGKIQGFPKFTDKGETFVGEQILYNFKTKQGTITLGETEVSEGYYFGSKIKRISDNELFVKDGCYTTCDHPHPHYYFGSPEMKVAVKDRVFLDPIVLYVEDMPIFILPFGLFFPNKSGRQSGIMIPSFFFSNSRGVVLQDFGYYFALSDYYDTQFNVDFFSKGGYTLKNSTRWKLLDVFDGSMDLEYGYTRYSVEDDYNKNYKVALRHNHTIDPQSRITTNVSFMSQDYNRNTNFRSLQSRMTQNVSSNASYSKSFDNGSSLSLAFNREQNIILDEDRTTFPRLSFSLPQLQPLKSLFAAGSVLPDWLRDLSLSYSGSGSYYAENIKLINGTDTTDKHNFRSSINHNPSISVSPKLGYFNLNPYFSFSANNYFRKMTQTYHAKDSINYFNDTITNSYEKGFFTEYNYSLGVDLSTRLYGIITPKILGVNAVRHTFQPSVGWSYSPDLSGEDYGFYGSYYDEANKRDVKYSHFATDGGGIASSRMSQSIRYSVLNSFEAKLFQGDTIPDKNAEFFRWTFNGSYDFTKDSLKFSDISMQFRIPTVSDINMSANANFALYDVARQWNETEQNYSGAYTRINTFLYENGKTPLHLTNFSLQLSTQFSSEGIRINPSFSEDQTQTVQDTTKTGLGERFKQRYDYLEEFYDFYGENSPGYSPINIPWNVSFGLTFQYTDPMVSPITRRINLTSNFNFKLTETWSFSGNAQYDFVNKELLAPSFDITKDLHCWQLTFQWWPIGYNAGFYLKFGIKAPQLQDLKIEKQDSPLLR